MTEANDQLKYVAFLSYSHRDQEIAARIHSILERHPLPRVLSARMTHGRRIFMDREELAASSDLGESLRRAIRSSQKLIVLCSKSAAASSWVNEEIRTFCESRGPRNILLVSVDSYSPTTVPAAVPDGWNGLIPAIPKTPRSQMRRETLRLLAGVIDVDYEDLRRRLAARTKVLRVAQIAALLAITAVIVFIATLTEQRDELARRTLAEQKLRTIERETDYILSGGRKGGGMAALASAVELVGSFGPEAAEALGPNFARPPSNVTNALETVLAESKLYGTRYELDEDASDIAFSPDGKLLVTANWDGSASTWDVATGRLRYDMRAHRARVRSVDVSSDGRKIATAGDDGTAWIWDAQTGEALHMLSSDSGKTMSVVFSPDAKWIATGSNDGSARIWDTGTGKVVHVLPNLPSAANEVRFSPDGRRLLTWGNKAAVWNPFTGEEICLHEIHEDWINDADFSPDGKDVVTASRDGTAQLWDAATCAGVPLNGHTAAVNSATFSVDGTRVATASADRLARIFSVTTGEVLHVLTGHTGGVNTAAFSPRGDELATASEDGTIRLWNVGTGGSLHVLSGHSINVPIVAYSPSGDKLATIGSDYDSSTVDTVRMWDAVETESMPRLQGHTARVNAIAFSPNGERAVTASDDGTARIWNGSDGQLLLTLGSHRSRVRSASFSLDGSKVLTASDDGTARLWNALDGAQLRVFESDFVVNAADLSPDGSRLVMASGNKLASVWDTGSGEILFEIELPDNCYDATFSRNGDWIATAVRDDTARLWDAATGAPSLVLEDYWSLNSVDFSFDDTRLITKGASLEARDSVTGQPIFTVRPDKREQPLVAVSLASDGRLIVAWGDEPAAIIDAATGATLYSVGRADYGVTALAFTPDAARVVVASDRGVANFYHSRALLEGCKLLSGYLEYRSVASTCDRESRLHASDRSPIRQPHEERMRDFTGESRGWIAVLICQLLFPALISFLGIGSSAWQRLLAFGKYPSLATAIFVVAYSVVSFWVTIFPYFVTKPRGHGNPAFGFVVSMALTIVAYWLVRRTAERWWMWASVAIVPGLLVPLLSFPSVVEWYLSQFDTIVPPPIVALIVSVADLTGEESGVFRAHVQAHEALSHVPVALAGLVMAVPVTFYAAHRLATSLMSRFQERVGCTAVGDVTALPLLFFSLNLIGIVVTPPCNAGLRHLEREADRQAMERTHDGLACATAAVSQDGVDRGIPQPGLFFVLWRTGQQTLAERIELCNDYRPH